MKYVNLQESVMNKYKTSRVIFITNSICFTSFVAAECGNDMCNEHMVVMAESVSGGVVTITDPKLPRQPIPSFDGSGYLKTIPGFSVTRKGGAGGDINLRGLAGSRVSIINDGQQLAGTCGGRMDPPTNYISPETYEKVTVIKGPQTVRHGPVGSAGTVLFERDDNTFYGFDGRAGLTTGSFGRQDYLTELNVGADSYYWSLDVNGSRSDNFEDGGGNSVQSRYERQSVNTKVGFTPIIDGLVELSYGRSSGDSEYADRDNKARAINNENWSLLAKQTFDGQVLTELRLQGYWNENDHVMDQFDRPVAPGETLPKGTNPRRTTYGGFVWGEFVFSQNTKALIGIDHINQVQDIRTATSLDELLAGSYQDVFGQQNWGGFIELENTIRDGTLYSGLRYDSWQTELMGRWASDSKKNKRNDDFLSGFVRYEYEFAQQSLYAGVGHAERVPDYWETMKAGQMLTLDSEKTDQLDIGWSYFGDSTVSFSLYYSKLTDYILIDNQATPKARNIDATLFGGEASLEYPLAQSLMATATVAYSRGENDSDHTVLGQVSPLEGRLILDYQYGNWSFGSLWRIVAAQERVAVGQGNIVGQDLGQSAGFGVLSLNGLYQFDDQFKLSFGVDNLFNKEYAEHISKSGQGNDTLPLEERTQRVNEPGRTLWAKLDYEF